MAVTAAPDLLRLLAVPVFAWAAVRDLKTRRVPNRIWRPLLGLGLVALLLEGVFAWLSGGFVWQQFLIGAAVSIGLLVPLGYGFWLIGAFGGADAKAVMVIAIVFPTVPTYRLGELVFPLVESTVSAFALTVLTNAVVAAVVYPLGLGLYNLLHGNLSLLMAVGRPVPIDRLERQHGRLLETPTGRTTAGLDLDALRMYLRWRGLDIDELRRSAAEFRDPASLPDEPTSPTDGAVYRSDGGDPWGAAEFLSTIDHGAYGTDADSLRDGLTVIADPDRDQVWVSPGIPFFIPLFVGLLLGLTYGDVLFGVFDWAGLF